MKTILKKIISQLFPSREIRSGRKMLKTGDKLYKRIITRLKTGAENTYPDYHRKNLFHRRLKQYQQLRRRGSIHAKAAAIRKLDKEWRKFQRDCVKKKKDTKIIPVSKATRQVAIDSLP
jgi:hypothetical protein